MKDLRDIIEAFEHSGDNSLALATVIEVSGSTYRRAGARMLLTESGRMTGMVSGGCLEADVLLHAREVMASGVARTVEYDTTQETDIVWGTGLGCRGRIRLLVEALPPFSASGSAALNPLVFFRDCHRHNHTGRMATVVEVRNIDTLQIGQRMLAGETAPARHDIKNLELAARLLADLSLPSAAPAGLRCYSLSRGSATLFIEKTEPPPRLLIFGAGADALPVARFAQALGWRVTVIDLQARIHTREMFDFADEVILGYPENPDVYMTPANRRIMVVMTHNYLLDLAVLRHALRAPFRYLGVLGPRRRTEKLLDALQAENRAITPASRQGLHSPIGLDTGADTPEQIALAIVAEIQCVLAARSGISLKHLPGGIHQHGDESVAAISTDAIPALVKQLAMDQAIRPANHASR